MVHNCIGRSYKGHNYIRNNYIGVKGVLKDHVPRLAVHGLKGGRTNLKRQTSHDPQKISVPLCTDMCKDTGTAMCIDMCIAMCTDMCIDMCMAICAVMCMAMCMAMCSAM